MALTPAQRLRHHLGEVIPEGGADTDTMFRDEIIDDLLENNRGVIELAALEGWRLKAAEAANLVDVTEGNAQQKMSQLREHAENMIKLYLRSSTGPTEGRARIGRVTRPPMEDLSLP